MTQFKRLLSVILCVVLIAATALFAIGCSNNVSGNEPEKTGETEQPPKEVGEGSKQFDFLVKDKDGNTTAFIVKTDKKTVGEALIELGLIEGDEGDYGLYVKKVNGITADYDKDKVYWAFYVDGEYAIAGVELTEIEEGKTYSFVVSK